MDAIVIVDRNWAIGRDGRLLFSLPADMRRFRELTENCAVIMGRRTLDSLPGGKALPRRRNIVLTRDETFRREGCEAVRSAEEALEAARGAAQVWVIGGSSVYAMLLRQCRRALVTKVDAAAPGADAFFPNLDHLPGWEAAAQSAPMEENGLTFRFVEYRNTRPESRGAYFSGGFTGDIMM